MQPDPGSHPDPQLTPQKPLGDPPGGFFAERLRIPVLWWVLATAFAASMFVAIGFYLGLGWGIGAAALILVVIVPVFLSYGSAELLVLPDRFQAGRASIEWRYLGGVTALDAEQARLRRGRDADARAWLLLRPYLPRAVEITIEDPDDPAPYWLIATRHPRRLSEALTARLRSGGA